MNRPAVRHRLRPVAAILLLVALLAGCGFQGATSSAPSPTPTASPTRATPEQKFPSQFTRDGTFQSHINIDNVDFVYTLWPTKSTPRTNEWFARGNKFFSFSLTAYDLDRRLRDRFKTKRKVYLGRIRVDSTTTPESGMPYRLDRIASRVTLDPEPVKTRRGMLITSPKGAFELRNQLIRPVPVGTEGFTLKFSADVHIQRYPGGKAFDRHVIRQEVPITIFPGELATKSVPIPVDAN